MKYVYILRSIENSNKTYIGLTGDLKRRLKDHNSNQSTYTSKYSPWNIETYVAFSNEQKAQEFERYLKHSGGWRFLQRRLI